MSFIFSTFAPSKENKMMKTKILPALLVAIGLAFAGWWLYLGVHELATMNRTVTVKGLSTRDVAADYVVWPMMLTIESNDLAQLQRDMERDKEIVVKFLTKKGLSAADISMGNINITNNWQNYYERRPDFRYTLTATIIISTTEVDKVIALQGSQSELLSQGVIANSYQWDISYQFNGLNELKPEMIEEATKNARAVAQKFADDSNSRLGGIRRASQGQFSVESDTNQPWKKHVRVVTTVDYSLR